MRRGHTNCEPLKGHFQMKKYRMKDPSGDWIETMAKSIEKAKSNFVYRLTRQPYGMFIGDAKDFVDAVEEVPG